jgi:hypothetical protein
MYACLFSFFHTRCIKWHYGFDVHDRPHFFTNFPTVRSILNFHSPFILFSGIPMHYTQTWSIHTVFPKIISLILLLHYARTTLLNKPLPGSSMSGCFSGIHHLFTVVVLTKRNIPHIFPIRSWTRVWSVCIFLKKFLSMAFTSYYWPQPTVFREACSEYPEADLRPRTVPCTAYNFEHWKGRTHPWHRRMLFTRNHLLHPVVPTPRGTQFLRWRQSTWSVQEHDLGELVL